MSEPTKPSIEEIQAAYNRVMASSESVGIDDDVSADARLVDAAIDELATLRDQSASLDEWRNRAKEQRLRAEAAEAELATLRKWRAEREATDDPDVNAARALLGEGGQE